MQNHIVMFFICKNVNAHLKSLNSMVLGTTEVTRKEKSLSVKVWWFNPGQQLSTARPLAHSPPVS